VAGNSGVLRLRLEDDGEKQARARARAAATAAAGLSTALRFGRDDGVGGVVGGEREEAGSLAALGMERQGQEKRQGQDVAGWHCANPHPRSEMWGTRHLRGCRTWAVRRVYQEQFR
jgi:hypothetical protein